MSFEAFYNGAVHHPGQLWAVAAAATLYAATRRDLDPGLWRYCVALGALSVVDAWLTSSEPYGLGPLDGAAASAVPLFFVIAGDLRFLVLALAATPDGRLPLAPARLAAAAGLSLVVPIVSQLVVWALPDSLASARALYLVYELLFFALAAALAAAHPNLRRAPWLRDLSRFVMLYYGLWAAADVWILATGSDLGFALRLVPNLLYYGGLIAAIAWLAPRHPPTGGTP